MALAIVAGLWWWWLPLPRALLDTLVALPAVLPGGRSPALSLLLAVR